MCWEYMSVCGISAAMQEENASLVVQTINLEGYVGQLANEVAGMQEVQQDLQASDIDMCCHACKTVAGISNFMHM